METLILYRFAFNQNYYTFTLMLLINIVICSKFSRARFIGPNPDSLVLYCRTTSASTASCTSKRMCCLTHCAGYCAPCQPLWQACFGWIRSPPPALFSFPCSFCPAPHAGPASIFRMGSISTSYRETVTLRIVPCQLLLRKQG